MYHDYYTIVWRIYFCLVFRNFSVMASLKQTISRTLQCPICLELLSDPKQLSCSHTFCKRCLDNMLTCSCQTETVNSLTCPICRSVTNVKHGDVMNLNTNIPLKSVVEDLRNSQQLVDCEDVPNGFEGGAFLPGMREEHV